MKFLSVAALPLVLYVVLMGAGCNVQKPGKAIEQVFKKTTPYEQYVKQLEKAELLETAMGKQWIARGELVLNDSLLVLLPYHEIGFFSAEKVGASAVRFSARRGERITASVVVKQDEQVKLFVDVFSLKPGGMEPFESVVAGEDISFDVSHDTEFVLRVQPELLRSCRYGLTITVSPQLAFPVMGKGNNDIKSLYGDARDGGKRKHEGIDIFAAKGTPVVAIADGFIAGVNENRLGGNVVWQRDRERGLTFYYAHLDKQLVKFGQFVKRGDTIGTVGNTGNARHTPPHLHLGIYGFGSSVDPLKYVFERNEKIAAVKNKELLGEQARISVKSADVRMSPVQKVKPVQKLLRYAPVEIESAVAGFYKVRMADGTAGFIASAQVEPLKQVRKIKVKTEGQELFDNFSDGAVVKANLKKDEQVVVLAELNEKLLVETAEGERGWLLN